MTKPALVLIEFQKQWTEPGLYRRLIGGQLVGHEVIATTVRLAEAARAAHIPVLHAPLIVDPNQPCGIFGKLTRGMFFGAGSERADFTAGVYRDGDTVVRGRIAFDAFVGSDLAEVLAALEVDVAYLAGFTTDQCVAKTYRTAIRRGIATRVVPECTATFTGWLQRRTERSFGDDLKPLDRALADFQDYAARYAPDV